MRPGTLNGGGTQLASAAAEHNTVQGTAKTTKAAAEGHSAAVQRIPKKHLQQLRLRVSAQLTAAAAQMAEPHQPGDTAAAQLASRSRRQLSGKQPSIAAAQQVHKKTMQQLRLHASAQLTAAAAQVAEPHQPSNTAAAQVASRSR